MAIRIDDQNSTPRLARACRAINHHGTLLRQSASSEAELEDMSTVYLPVIDEADFEGFKSIIQNDFPADYQEWRELYSRWAAEYPDVVEVSVRSNDFDAYVKKKGLRPDKNSLLKFSEAAATRKIS